MISGPLVFFGLLGLCPLSALVVTYGYAYRKRLHGAPGNKLEDEMVTLAGALTGLFTLVAFLTWPVAPHPWYQMPGFSLLVGSLMSNPESDPNVESLRAVVGLVFSGFLALLVRLVAPSLSRKLVRDVPRYWRPEPKIKRR